jgi:KDO2-lipid IV(A) lauroyltransferase
VEEAVYSEDMSISLAALNRGIESCVRRCAEQYQWEYKRFRVRPRAGRDLYADV